MPPEAICTLRTEKLTEGNLKGRGVQIAKGGIFFNTSRLEAVYWHYFFQNGSVLEITPQISRLYWQYMILMHSSSIKNNDQFFVAGCKIYFFAPYQYNGGDFVFECFGLFITITSGCRVVENNVFLGQAQQLAARECGVSYTGLAELPQEHNVHFCSR